MFWGVLNKTMITLALVGYEMTGHVGSMSSYIQQAREE